MVKPELPCQVTERVTMYYMQKWGQQVGGGVFLGEPIILESRRLLHFFQQLCMMK